MRHDRLIICLSAVLAGFIFAQMSLLPAVIGLAFCAWIIAAALMPAPADESTKEANYDATHIQQRAGHR